MTDKFKKVKISQRDGKVPISINFHKNVYLSVYFRRRVQKSFYRVCDIYKMTDVNIYHIKDGKWGKDF